MREILTLGLAQMASTADWEANREGVRGQLAAAGTAGCDLVVFPENVLCLGRGDTVRHQARAFGDLVVELGQLCREAGQAAVFGGVPVPAGAKIANSSLAFARDGALLARYDKVHLFQFRPGEPGGIDETTTYVPGLVPVAFEVAGWRVGLSVCYDLRFPELYRSYAGAHLLLCTAAFTRPTGEAHWELLLRARAVENLSYVAGVGQCGRNPEAATEYYGHSLAVSPWGEVIGRATADRPDLLPVRLDARYLDEVRRVLPALQHRRLGLTAP